MARAHGMYTSPRKKAAPPKNAARTRNQRLVWKLIEVLKQHENLRKVIWRRPWETVIGTNNVSACKQLVPLTLKDEPPYKKAFAGAEKQGQREYSKVLGVYGQAIKVKLHKLGGLYGSTRTGLDDPLRLCLGFHQVPPRCKSTRSQERDRHGHRLRYHLRYPRLLRLYLQLSRCECNKRIVFALFCVLFRSRYSAIRDESSE
jgi:hypothetical protein